MSATRWADPVPGYYLMVSPGRLGIAIYDTIGSVAGIETIYSGLTRWCYGSWSGSLNFGSGSGIINISSSTNSSCSSDVSEDLRDGVELLVQCKTIPEVK